MAPCCCWRETPKTRSDLCPEWVRSKRVRVNCTTDDFRCEEFGHKAPVSLFDCPMQSNREVKYCPHLLNKLWIHTLVRECHKDLPFYNPTYPKRKAISFMFSIYKLYSLYNCSSLVSHNIFLTRSPNLVGAVKFFTSIQLQFQ